MSSENNTPWYHRTTIYQIYPRSFYDSNSDGIGDLQGIIQKLDYIHGLGFETIWISPFFASPQADTGYDISNYTDIAPEYGTMDDALRLIEEVHQRGMKIVFDMVMNHTSIEHPWFKESQSSRNNPKSDWYIWRDSPHPFLGEGPGVRAKPNNWQSLTGGSGWHYSAERGQYFWSSFLPFQPDLNYRNSEVKRAMFDIVHFWLSQGVDGFRLDIFNVIYKDAEFRDNPFSFKLLPTEDDPSGFFQEVKYNLNQPESFEFAKEFRSVCDEFGDKILLGEVSGDRSTIRKFLGDEVNNGLGLVFDFEMLNFQFSADYFRKIIQRIEAHFPNPFMPVYVFSNHDRRRSIHKLGGDLHKAKLLAMLQLTVRGVPCMYYGEEIGMTDLPLPFNSAFDPIPHKFKFIPRFVFDFLGMTINRDEVRTPMQWDGRKNAGFSSAEKTWLPVHGNYKEINVEKESGEDDSLLHTVQSVLKIRRQEKAIQEGSLQILNGLPEDVLGYSRKFEDEKIVLLLNFSSQEKEIRMDVSECLFKISTKDEVKNQAIRLDGLGGVIFKSR
ncbi:MAG: alpha-glucosidase [Chloroflexi bacterium]|nr:alpha-glucosidase [Chloroflexota bacterium]